MTDLSLETLNRRVAVAAVRQECGKRGVDPEALLDSQRFYSQLGGLDPDEPGFTARIREMVGAAAGQVPAAGQARQPAAAGTARSGGEHNGAAGGNRQWTLDDVNRLPKTRQGGEDLKAAIDAGLLRDLGYAPERTRR